MCRFLRAYVLCSVGREFVCLPIIRECRRRHSPLFMCRKLVVMPCYFAFLCVMKFCRYFWPYLW